MRSSISHCGRFDDSEQDLAVRLLSSVTPDRWCWRTAISWAPSSGSASSRSAKPTWSGRCPPTSPRRCKSAWGRKPAGPGRSDSEPQDRARHTPRHRVHDRRLEHRLPTRHQPARPQPRTRPGTGRPLRRTLGDRGLLRELKIAQCGLRRLHGLRSGSVEGVRQESGRLCALSAEPRPGPSRRGHDP